MLVTNTITKKIPFKIAPSIYSTYNKDTFPHRKLIKYTHEPPQSGV